MEQGFKMAAAVSLLLFAGGVIASHAAGALFPGLGIGVVLAAVVLSLGVLWSRPRPLLAVMLFVGLGTLYRIYSFLFPRSMIAFDPDAHAVASQVIVSTGRLFDLAPGFYKLAPLFRVYGAEAAILLDIPIDSAFVIYPLVATPVFGLATFAIVHRVSGDELAGVLSVAVLSVAAPLTKYTYGPIPMAMAAVFVTMTVLVLASADHRVDPPRLALVLSFTLAAGLTHKIPVLFIFGIVFWYVAYTGVLREVTSLTIRENYNLSLVVLIGAMLVLQWIYITDFITVSFLLLAGARRIGSPVIQTPRAAIRVTTTAIETVQNVGYYFLTVGIGGVGGLWLLTRSGDRTTRLLLVAAGVTVGFSLPDIFVGAAPGFQRIIVYGIPFVAALVGLALASAYKARSRTVMGVAILALCTVLILNPVAGIAAPDQGNSSRMYLTAQEVTAKQWAGDHATDIVYMDLFYRDEAVDFERAASGPDWHQKTVPEPTVDPGLLSEELYNGTLLRQNYDYIAIRQNVSVYRLVGGEYRLQWSPTSALDAAANPIYDDGGVRVYFRTGGKETD